MRLAWYRDGAEIQFGVVDGGTRAAVDLKRLDVVEDARRVRIAALAAHVSARLRAYDVATLEIDRVGTLRIQATGPG